jgi:hypothetical protein
VIWIAFAVITALFVLRVAYDLGYRKGRDDPMKRKFKKRLELMDEHIGLLFRILHAHLTDRAETKAIERDTERSKQELARMVRQS